MNEDFVPYELAVKLKEKGFREKCHKHFYPNSKDWFLSSTLECDNYSSYVDAPTIYQVLKWLRKEKKIHLAVEISDSGWHYILYPNIGWENGELKSDKWFYSFNYKSSYELAAIAGIEYVIDNNLI